MLEEILEESWAYREMVREASLKALMLGREEGRKEAEKRAIEKAKNLARQEAQIENREDISEVRYTCSIFQGLRLSG